MNEKKKRTKRVNMKRVIPGPNGETYLADVLDSTIVKRDALVRRLISRAEKLSELVQKYAYDVARDVDEYLAGKAGEYGEEWVGNTILRTLDGTMQVEVDIQQQKSYDERLAIAAEKIRRWIDSKLDNVDDPGTREALIQLSSIAKAALRVDQQGKVDQKKLNMLKKFEFANAPEWVEAIRLLNESEQISGKKRYIRFKKAGATGKLEGIPVNYYEF